MAAVGGMGEDNSVQEGEESPGNALSTLKEMYKRNGINHSCQCSEKSCKSIDAKRAKTVPLPKLNGVSKITTTPSIPSLRSRREKRTLLPEPPRRPRRPTRSEKRGSAERNSVTLNKPVENCVNNNNNNDSSMLVDHSAALCSDQAEVCGSVQNSLLNPISPDTARSCTPPLSSASSGSSVHCGPSAPLPGVANSAVSVPSGGRTENCTASSSHGKVGSTTSSSGKNVNSSTQSATSLKSWPANPIGSRTAVCTASATTGRFGNYSDSAARSGGVAKCSTAAAASKQAANQVTCQWFMCGHVVKARELMDHIRIQHVETQVKKVKNESDKFVCLWGGCKVYNKQSCSQSWLDRHILNHSGDKPFRCIVDGCGLRFPSHNSLERHVNSHFNVCQPVKGCSSRSKDDTPSKLLKKKKLKRRKSWLIKTDDFFDSRVMESLGHQLVMLSETTKMDTTTTTTTTTNTTSGSNGATNATTITFRSSVIARRTEESGKVKVLLQWTPKDILPDVWVPESQVEQLQQQSVPLSSLPREDAERIHPSIYASHRYRKHRRK